MASSIEGSEAVDKCKAMETSPPPSPLTAVEQELLRRALPSLPATGADRAFIEGVVRKMPLKVTAVWGGTRARKARW